MGDRYVAMGDSYSSGLGSLNYDLNSGSCYRSTDSYAYYVFDNKPLPAPPMFVACAGAVTNNIMSYGFDPPQKSQANADTKYITLTIGGNDIDFVGIAGACADYTGHPGWSCTTNSSLVGDVSGRLDTLNGVPDADSVTSNYQPIHSIKSVLEVLVTQSPDAEILIGGYPHLFGASSNNYTYDGDAPGAHKCIVTAGFGPIVTYAYWDIQWMNSTVDSLNTIISSAVEDINDPNVKYVPPDEF